MSDLQSLGFWPALCLRPTLDRKSRPIFEIAARLMALDAVYRWVAFRRSFLSNWRIDGYIQRNRLREWMDEEENAIISLSRRKARRIHGETIGWKLENMWPLAWALGFPNEPTIEASQIDNSISSAIVNKFLPGLGDTIDSVADSASPRPLEGLIALEFRFFCAHNAVRNAQLGRDTVPKGFHPVVHGGAVHERRHSLTWILSPGTSWDETELGT